MRPPANADAVSRVYLDHAATTRLRPECAGVLAELGALALNPSSVHGSGQFARRLLEEARGELAGAVGADPGDIVFTSGATESANLALRGMADAFAARGRPMIVASSALEHACVRETVAALVRAGRVAHRALPVSADGRADVAAAGGADALMLMAVQNETGVVQDLGAAREFGIGGRWWFCDASQALGRLELDLGALGAWLAALSSHKVGGPVGVGALVGAGIRHIAPQITGGPQEHELRAGTTPVALCAAFARAATLAVRELGEAARALRDLEAELLGALSGHGVAYARNGGEPRAPGFVNISVPGIGGPDFVIALDSLGIDVSAGAACSTGVMEVSPALSAMFPGDAARAAGGLRLTLGRGNTREEMRRVARCIAEVAARGPRGGRT